MNSPGSLSGTSYQDVGARINVEFSMLARKGVAHGQPAPSVKMPSECGGQVGTKQRGETF